MAKLLLNSASGQAQELHLKPGLSRVGRNDGNDIQIEHPSISSFHCEVNCAGDTVTIKDLGSTNGTFIERAPIQEACLAHGQRLQLGSVEMILDAANAQVVAQNSTPVLEATRLKAEPQTAAQIPGKPRLSVRLSEPSAPAEAAQAQSPVASISHSRPSAPKPTHQADRTEAEQQARSKMLWGDPPEDVTKHLMMHGFSVEEASTLSAALLRERVKMIRNKGMRKILTGFGLMCVPLGTLLVMLHMGAVLFQLLGITGAVGLWGAWMCLKGLFMVLAPKSEPGDVADK